MFLICGEALYDLFMVDSDGAARLDFDARPGGSPFNVAIGIRRLGASAALLTGLSTDILGSRLAAILHGEGVSSDYLVRSDRPTTVSLVGLDETGAPAYTFYGSGSADCGLTTPDIVEPGSEVTGFHFGSYSIAVAPVADTFAELASRHAKKFISLDPNVRPTVEPDMAQWRRRLDALIPLANLVKVSDEDIRALHPGQDPLDVVRDWARRGPDMVVLTRGRDEIHALRGPEQVRLDPPVVDAIDTVGAGDSFMAALLARIGAQEEPAHALCHLPIREIEDMLQFAATAAAITCSRRGADLPRLADIEARQREKL